MAASEETKLFNLNKLKAVIEDVEKDQSLNSVVELKKLSNKRYPLTDEWILWHFEKDTPVFLTDKIRKSHTCFTHYLLKDCINELCYKRTHNFPFKHVIAHMKFMMTEDSLRAPRCGVSGCLIWD